MRRILVFFTCLALLLFGSCDIHEWPVAPEYVKLHLKLSFESEMTEWHHSYEGGSVVEKGFGKTYDNSQDFGRIRYIVRTYPKSEKQRAVQDYVQEFVFTRDVANGYDQEVTLDILSGNYNIMVWSDLVESSDDDYFYNADDFGEIMLQGDHQGNNNYRDAFYGKSNITLYSTDCEQAPDTISITMKRPLAKFEVVAKDLPGFIGSKSIDVGEFKVKIQYVGFMPDACSMFTDKPIDSSTGVIIDSALKELSGDQASMGFDYVFISEEESVVTIRIAVYNNDGEQTSMTDLLEVPIKPSYHTILTGNFLMQNASGGIDINPGYDGNYNVIIP